MYTAAGTALGAWQADGVTDARDLATDGTDVWVVGKDAASGILKVFRFVNEAARRSGDQAPTPAFPLDAGDTSPTGLATYGSTFWVTDATAQKVFAYDASGTALGNWSFDPTLTGVTGVTLDPTGASDDLWLVDAQTGWTYRYAHAQGLRSGLATAADSFALAAGDVNPQGIADPPPAQQTNQGTDFWLAFPGNNELDSPRPWTLSLQLEITSDVATTGTVEVPGLNYSQSFSVTPGVATLIGTIPTTADLAS